jgi:hypothetical protein
MGDHRSVSKIGSASIFHSATRALGMDNFSIHLIRAFPCANKADLETEEYKETALRTAAGITLYNELGNAHGAYAAQKKIYDALPASKAADKQRRVANKLIIRCAACNLGFDNQSKLNIHNNTQIHQMVTDNVLNQRGNFDCSKCNCTKQNIHELRAHCSTSLHKE